MVRAKTEKIILSQYGDYLGMEKGCYILKHQNGEIEKYPQFENQRGEVILKSGNTVWASSKCVWDRNSMPTQNQSKLREDRNSVSYRFKCRFKLSELGKRPKLP
jgi:hypothetical protein